jgi:hypothetical protein
MLIQEVTRHVLLAQRDFDLVSAPFELPRKIAKNVHVRRMQDVEQDSHRALRLAFPRGISDTRSTLP